ncbi:unnamed protein product, partial [Tetraodon nigroviridis]
VSQMKQQRVAVAAVCSLLGLFGNSGYPVAMELSVECSYPVGEATSTGLIIMSGQIQGVLYIILLQALTTRITEAPLSTCDSEALDWKGRSPVCRAVLRQPLRPLGSSGLRNSEIRVIPAAFLQLFFPSLSDAALLSVFPDLSVHAGAGRPVQSLHLLLRHLLPHAVPTSRG